MVVQYERNHREISCHGRNQEHLSDPIVDQSGGHQWRNWEGKRIRHRQWSSAVQQRKSLGWWLLNPEFGGSVILQQLSGCIFQPQTGYWVLRTKTLQTRIMKRMLGQHTSSHSVWLKLWLSPKNASPRVMLASPVNGDCHYHLRYWMKKTNPRIRHAYPNHQQLRVRGGLDQSENSCLQYSWDWWQDSHRLRAPHRWQIWQGYFPCWILRRSTLVQTRYLDLTQDVPSIAAVMIWAGVAIPSRGRY